MNKKKADAFFNDFGKLCQKHDVGHALIIVVDKEATSIQIQEAVQIESVPAIRMIKGFAESLVNDMMRMQNKDGSLWN